MEHMVHVVEKEDSAAPKSPVAMFSVSLFGVGAPNACSTSTSSL